jgi:hypothetical protein
MPNTKEAAILSAMAEAVTWRNDASEVDGPRKGQRVVVYPKELTQLDAVLTAGDPSIDSENGHPIAYERVLTESQKYEHPPLSLREDSEQIVGDPVMSESVPKWLCMAERVATGNRRRVLEDGNDTWHSDDEAKEELIPDEEPNAYTPEMDPKKGPVVLSQREAARQRAASQALKKSKSQPPRSQTPVGGSSDDDDPNGSDMIWSSSRQIFRKNKAKSRQPTPAPMSASETARQPTPLTSPANSDDEWMSEDQRRKVESAKKMAQRATKKALQAPPSQKALPAPEPVPEAKASYPRKGQESPETKVSKLMVDPKTIGEQSWKLAIRGRFRANGYVCCFIQPFQNLNRNLFPPRRFSPPGNSAGPMALRVNRLTEYRYLACTTPSPARRAGVRCSPVPRRGQTK